MADSRTVRMLDMKLIEEGILSKDFKKDYQTVHDMLNSYMRRSGGKLPEDNFRIGDRKLRDWLMILYKQGASQEKLTNYLRCGLGHLSFDHISSQNPGISASDLVTRSLQSLKLRKYHRSFFRVSRQKEKTTISLKKK
ncbi:MAG: hypothetical protein ACMUFK_01730 [Thermoplasmatota archaeon]